MAPRNYGLVLFAVVLACGLLACGDDDAVAPKDGPPGTSGWTAMNSGTDQTIRAIWVPSLSGNDIFAVGDGGTILRFDGTDWNAMNSGTNENLRGVWGNTTDRVIATGELGSILVFDGSDWSITPDVAPEPIGRVSGFSDNFMVAAGGGPAGSFLQFDGFDWSVRSSGNSQAIIDVAGTSGTIGPGVIMVGDGGSAFVATQDTVLAIATGTSTNLRAVVLVAEDHVIVVGDDGTMLAMDLTQLPYSGADVRPLAGPAADLTGIAFREYNDLFLCAADGSIFTHNRCSARSSKAGGSGLLQMARVSDTRVVAVGEGGTILSYSRPAPAECPDAVSVSISTGTTPTFSWSPDCPVNLVLVEQEAGDMWLIEGDGNVIRPGVRYGDHHPCETGFWYEDALTPGVEYEVILFRYDGLLDTYTLIALETFVP